MTPSSGSGERRALDPSRAALYNVRRLRTDIWNRLRDGARRLRRIGPDDLEVPELTARCAEAFELLRMIESCCAFPGSRVLEPLRRRFEAGDYENFAKLSIGVVRLLSSGAYRRLDLSATRFRDWSDLLDAAPITDAVLSRLGEEQRPYFETLFVDDIQPHEESELRQRLRELRRPEDAFMYETVVTHTFEDALIAALVNPNVQSIVVRYSFPFHSADQPELLTGAYALLGQDPQRIEALKASERSLLLGEILQALRPELDLFLVTDAPVENVAGDPSRAFRRVFYQQENYRELHLSILKGVHERFETPFFSALRAYSRKPTGMFHALPISKGSSIDKSHWISDMARFYGHNVFQAETSATTGGLDSLLQPQGTIKRAQELAARAFGARQTFFVTNGTSTANKIVMQGLCRPGDIVLLSHDCHKSHHYAVILSGAKPIYLDAYPIPACSMYGGVTLAEIKRTLLSLRRAGKLDQVRMLLLTNITFDGLTYDPHRVMEEVLAIKPDMIFVWDEAWSAYARFSPTLRRRTAMDAANRLRERLRGPGAIAAYRAFKADADRRGEDDAWFAEHRLVPDPDRARVRVYVTQSTHKTLTALRQGSMIHVNDEDFESRVRHAFHEAFMTHTSTSPNYQIIASLDVGRRQVELEGYELVQQSLELAMMLRERVHGDPLLAKYFRVMGALDLIPAAHRPSGLEYYWDAQAGFTRIEQAWMGDEFVLDPTRVTIHVGRTGMDGDTFKKLLIDRFDIQINKTSRNTVLFMIHIGMTRGTVAHLVKVLTQIAHELDEKLLRQSAVERRLHDRNVVSFTRELPPLPNFSRFHDAFRDPHGAPTPEGDIRKAFFLGCDDASCEYVRLDAALSATAMGAAKTADVRSAATADAKNASVAEGMTASAPASPGSLMPAREFVSAGFVTPYPPGFPILVPGQVITADILAFLQALDVKEIHGYEPEFGLRVFTRDALEALNGRDLETDARRDRPSSSPPVTLTEVATPAASAGGRQIPDPVRARRMFESPET